MTFYKIEYKYNATVEYYEVPGCFNKVTSARAVIKAKFSEYKCRVARHSKTIVKPSEIK